jgi:hypothetical protein
MPLRLDPWTSDYSAAFSAQEAAPLAAERVVLDVEVSQWQPLAPQEGELPYDEILFVDGSRRLEARLFFEEIGVTAFGALGSFGVGVASCCPRGSRPARLLEVHIARYGAMGSGCELPAITLVPCEGELGELRYALEPVVEREPEKIERRLQFAMLEAERRLLARLSDDHPAALIICDGPRPRLGETQQVIGYVKTTSEMRLGAPELEVIRALAEGERTPLYLVKEAAEEMQRFEWCLRLRDPRPWLFSLAGVVRLQAHAGRHPEANLPAVQRLADALCHLLPRFASRQYQDPRAPQQLLPVRAIESELRRRMGHRDLIRRRLARHLAAQEGR